MNETGMILCYGTASDEKIAADIARVLVEERLVACVNILPGMKSIYRWEEKIETSNEVVMILKTRAKLWGTLLDRFLELNPYENPCLLQIPIEKAAPLYLQWMSDEVHGLTFGNPQSFPASDSRK